MFEELTEKLKGSIDKLKNRSISDKEALQEFIKEIQRALLMADVNVEKVFELSKNIEKQALKTSVMPGLTRKEQIIKIFYDELTNVLGGEAVSLEVDDEKITTFLLVGIQGAGKTSSCAKLAYYLKKEGYKPGLLSTDIYRPGAQNQLKQLSDKISVPFFEVKSNSISDITKNGVQWLKEQKVNTIVVDTAGRHKEEKDLLEEMKMISDIIKPDLIFLVIDGTIGQLAKAQAEAFHRSTQIGGLIITKLDGAAKGGGSLAAASVTGAKIYFLTSGENVERLEFYNPSKFTSQLLGMGDIQIVLDKIKEVENIKTMKERLDKMSKGKFTLMDLMDQVDSIQKMGSLNKVLDLIPGIGSKVPKDAVKDAEKKAKKWRFIIYSMTDDEKINPEIIKGTRLRRISKGSGVEDRDVKDLIKQFQSAKKLMKSNQGRKIMKMMRSQSKDIVGDDSP